jgi:hypothetical protein
MKRTTPEEPRLASNAEINRDLRTLTRIYSLAVKDGRLASRPHIALLREDSVRTGFFEPHQYRSVLSHLPAELRPIVTFAYKHRGRVDRVAGGALLAPVSESRAGKRVGLRARRAVSRGERARTA